MKKIYILLFVLLSLSACKKDPVDNTADMEIIQIDMNAGSKENFSSFLEKIEVIPLETNDSSLLRSFQKFSYCEEQNIYVIMDRDMIVYLFSNDGRFVSSSSKAYGQGPGQYVTIANACSNPYTKTVDLLDPYGVIYSYDLNFNFKQKKSIDKSQTTYASVLPLSANKYLLSPLVFQKEEALHLVDYERKEISQMMKYSENLATTNMVRDPMVMLDDKVFFSPGCLNYHFYQIDKENVELNPIVKLDFKGGMVEEEMLNDKFEKFSHNKRSVKTDLRNGNIMIKRNDYLMDSNHPLPLIKLMNEKYVYVHIVENRKPSNFIYNRQTKESFLQAKDSPFKMPYIIEMKDNNVLYTLIAPFQIERYINPQFMSEETLRVINNLKEDDNPVVMKYYLKEYSNITD